jgi:hypothetical protein
MVLLWKSTRSAVMVVVWKYAGSPFFRIARSSAWSVRCVYGLPSYSMALFGWYSLVITDTPQLCSFENSKKRSNDIFETHFEFVHLAMKVK